MALVAALRFDGRSGAVCADQETWFLLRRKTLLGDLIYSLGPTGIKQVEGTEVLYAGVGHPSFHHEVAARARADIQAACAADPRIAGNPQALGGLVRGAFARTMRRRADDQLRFIYGFSTADLHRGSFTFGGETVAIAQDRVKQRALSVAQLKEEAGGGATPPNEACLGVLASDGSYSAYALKAEDCVLSYQSCGFDALGQGRLAAASRVAKQLNTMYLSSRRAGVGRELGLFILIDAVLEAWDHYGQVGGGLRIVIADSTISGNRKLLELADERGRLGMELVRAERADLLTREQAIDLLNGLAYGGIPWQKIEQRMFMECRDFLQLEKLLRGYKTAEGGLPASPLLRELLTAPAMDDCGGGNA